MLSEITEAFGLQPTRKVNILYHTLNRKLFTTTVAEDWHWFAQMIDSAFSPRPTPGLITMNGRKVSATFGAVVPSIFGTVEFDPDLIEWKNNVLAPGRLIDLADVLAEGEDIETNVSKCEKNCSSAWLTHTNIRGTKMSGMLLAGNSWTSLVWHGLVGLAVFS
jgi:hypothetical protein